MLKISIITIVRNCRTEIVECIESVLSQTYKNIEYIVIDGASTDGTLEIIRRYQDRITKIISEKDVGLYDALNKGVRMATGDVIGFVHADDFFPSTDVLSTLAKEFTADIGAVYGDQIYVSKSDPKKIVRYWSAGEFNKKNLKWGWMPPHPSFYLRRTYYELIKLDGGGYFDTHYRISADYDFMIRVLSKTDIKVRYIPCPIIKMRIGGTSNQSLKNLVLKSMEDYKSMKRNRIGGLFTLLCKNIQKLHQFVVREKIK